MKANDHESYGSYTLLAFIIPIIGVILGIMYMGKDKKLDRKLGEHLLATGVLAFLFWWLLLSLMGA